MTRSGECARRCGGCAAAIRSSPRQAAVAILEPLGPTAELAAAYRNLASFRIDQGLWTSSSRSASALRNSRSDSVYPRCKAGRRRRRRRPYGLAGGDWEPVLRRALSIALENGLEPEAGFAYTNLHELHCANREYAKADPYFLDGVAYCEDHDLLTYYTCLRGVRTSSLERLGRWDESAGLAEAVLAAIASPVNRMIPMTSLAKVAARRGDPDVWPHLDAAMTAADGTTRRCTSAPSDWPGPRPAGSRAIWLRRGRKPNSRTMRSLTPPIPGSTARSRCGCDVRDRPGQVSANWPSPTGCSSPGTIAGHPNCSMRWAAPTTLRSRCSKRLTSYRCDERSNLQRARGRRDGADHSPEDAFARYSIRSGRAASRDT